MRERDRRGTRRAILSTFVIVTAAVRVAAAGGEAAGNGDAVDKLIHRSSAATQIETSGNEAARAKQREADDLYQRALEAQAKGQSERESQLLREATKTMMEAVRLAKSDAVVEGKRRTDFDRRAASVEALVTAYDRIVDEKGGTGEKNSIGPDAQARLTQARETYEAGREDEAQAMLDEAYASVTTGIEQLRGGDRLVRSLKFATEEEEYHYELDRNDTHQMLIKMMKEKMDRPGVARMVEPMLTKAASLRKEAENTAASGQYGDAITILEESTAQLVRAIRAAGIYIPG